MSIFGLGQNFNEINEKIVGDKPTQKLIKKLMVERNQDVCKKSNVRVNNSCKTVKKIYKNNNQMLI